MTRRGWADGNQSLRPSFLFSGPPEVELEEERQVVAPPNPGISLFFTDR